MQASLGELAQPLAAKRVAFGGKQRALELWGSPESADCAGGADHAVIRQPGFRRLPKNIADGARGARPSRHSCDIAVGRDTSGGNPGDDAEDTAREGRALRQFIALRLKLIALRL